MNSKQKENIFILLATAHEKKYPGRYEKFAEPDPIDPVFDALHEAIRLLVPNEFADARATMAKEFEDKSQGKVYNSYRDNVAMLLHDESRKKDPFEVVTLRGELRPEFCDELADKIMHRIFFE